MKNMVKISSIVLVLSLVSAFSLLPPPAAYAKKAQDIKFVLVGGAEGGQEVSAESMAINMFIGALDYRVRKYHVLKGKYLSLIHI